MADGGKAGWLHETTNGPTGLKRELHYGALAALDADYPEEEQRQSGRLAATDDDYMDGDAFLADKIAELSQRIEASQRFLQTLLDARRAGNRPSSRGRG